MKYKSINELEKFQKYCNIATIVLSIAWILSWVLLITDAWGVTLILSVLWLGYALLFNISYYALHILKRLESERKN